MDARHVVDAYLTESRTTFPNNTRAIKALQSLGPPPTSPDIENPSPAVWKALQAITALADNVVPGPGRKPAQSKAETANVIRGSWSSCIGLWVRMFLENFIPEKAYFSVPSSSAGKRFLIIVFGVLPMLLVFPSFTSDETQVVRELKGVSPNFPRLLIKPFLFQLERDHPDFTWAGWGRALGGTLFYNDNDLSQVMKEIAVSAKKPLHRLFIDYLQRQCKAFREDFYTMGNVRYAIIFFKFCAEPSYSSVRDFTFNGGPAALTRVIASLVIRKRTLLHIPDESPAFQDAYACVGLALSRLKDVAFISPLVAKAMLDGGIVISMLLAQRFYSLRAERMNKAVSMGFGAVLRLISLFFVYPSVLRRFIRSMKMAKAYGIDWDELPPSQTNMIIEPLRKTWTDLKTMASDMHTILREMRLMCGYSKCPRNLADDDNEDQDGDTPRYVNCSVCKHLSYCSRECAKKNWKARHRDECAALGEGWKNYWGLPSMLDILFFEELSWKFVHRHGEAIYQAMVKRRDEKRDYDAPIPRAGDVVRIDFSKTDVLSAEHFTITDIETLLQDKKLALLSQQKLQLVRDCSRRADAEGRLCVVALVPSIGLGLGSLWTSEISMDLPKQFFDVPDESSDESVRGAGDDLEPAELD
ncbi:hypothetical protein VNI00_013967 [Paramarasmius palmivorus]|uniref:MYND-type domain-containing protein n=1 Tax=Paramarasmius palmivorus TaxID=297713 RepID=A0AAW0BXB6_9AGAR